jgi:hypothetical protein
MKDYELYINCNKAKPTLKGNQAIVFRLIKRAGRDFLNGNRQDIYMYISQLVTSSELTQGQVRGAIRGLVAKGLIYNVHEDTGIYANAYTLDI